MPRKSRAIDENDVFNMTCDKLRKECKKKRLSHVGKKSELQFRLMEFLQLRKEDDQNEQQDTIQEEEHEDEPMETDEPQNQEEPANLTFTIEDDSLQELTRTTHEGTPTNAVGLVLDEESKKLCADLGVDLQNFEVKSRPRVHRHSARKSLRITDTTTEPLEASNPEDAVENRGVTPSRQRAPSRVADRFAMIHAQDFDKMESLGEHKERVQKRHENLTANVPDSIKRLATPKSVKKRERLSKGTPGSSSRTRSWQPRNPAKMKFNFGNHDVNSFAEVVSARPEVGECSSTSNVSKKPASKARAHVDVKKLTKVPKSTRGAVTPRKVVIPATRTDESTFVDYISTPKGATPRKTPRRNAYTPYAGRKVFVDTTQLTDREYNLAAEEGLIPGKAATKSAMELRQLESKKRRDDIIALKRKMNIS